MLCEQLRQKRQCRGKLEMFEMQWHEGTRDLHLFFTSLDCPSLIQSRNTIPVKVVGIFQHRHQHHWRLASVVPSGYITYIFRIQTLLKTKQNKKIQTHIVKVSAKEAHRTHRILTRRHQTQTIPVSSNLPSLVNMLKTKGRLTFPVYDRN